MANYVPGRKLSEAIPCPRTRNDEEVYVWETPGLHVDYPDGFPEGFTVCMTFVISTVHVPFCVALLYQVGCNTGIQQIGTFSTLEELKQHHPQLLELDGNAYIF